MKFVYQKNELAERGAAGVNSFLLTNGLGGYASLSSVFSAPRCDQGLLVAAVKAPNARVNLVHRLCEKLICGEKAYYLSAQDFADGSMPENGNDYLESYEFDVVPVWRYAFGDVRITRRCCVAQEENTAYVLYTAENSGDGVCCLDVTPLLKFVPKEEALTAPKVFTYDDGTIRANGYSLKIHTNGTLRQTAPSWQWLAYPEDAKDGRPEKGLAGSCCHITMAIQPGQTVQLEIGFSTMDTVAPGEEVLQGAVRRAEELADSSGFHDPVARQLVLSADAYIARRDSTNGKTILAGYPLFSDWGRDTMIALPGCTLATGRYADAKSILRTFLAYEKDGLVPNLFPEGDQEPMYNTVDAALLLIDAVWLYVQATNDWAFAKEAWPVMERIIESYRKGTHHAIGMDADGLVFAGQGLDQVTWMDVCVQGVLPTPRHGKPVEINAYWYNALMIMDRIAEKLGCDQKDYAVLAAQVKVSFTEKFYIKEKGYLRDVLSGTQCDEQIRCNQIWALSMAFTMLNPEQEKAVLDTVKDHLYTPCGLRTLSPEDPQYHPHYGGAQFDRDMAYHQGTTWVFPMGAYYRAYLKVHGNTPAAIEEVKAGLSNISNMLHQGCAGQLPEIYDGNNPYEGKGCFAQAWSVGEILRVYETIEKESKA